MRKGNSNELVGWKDQIASYNYTILYKSVHSLRTNTYNINIDVWGVEA